MLTLASQVAFLKRLGLPTRTASQRKVSWEVFQYASTWHNYDAAAKKAGPLTADGVPGPKTEAHVRASIAHGYRIAPHFSLSEFTCGGAGHTHVSIEAALVKDLEDLRAKIGPITILNGYRCPAYNRQVAGAPNSAHMMWPSRAADIRPHPKPATVKGLGFHGIGVRDTDNNSKTARVVVHLDHHPKTAVDTVFVDE